MHTADVGNCDDGFRSGQLAGGVYHQEFLPVGTNQRRYDVRARLFDRDLDEVAGGQWKVIRVQLAGDDVALDRRPGRELLCVLVLQADVRD